MATVKAVAAHSEAERDRGLDLLMETEAALLEIRTPSLLGTGLLTLILGGLGFDEDNPAYYPAFITALFGYATRMSQQSPPAPAEDAQRVADLLPRDPAGELDYEALAEDPNSEAKLRALVDYLAEVDEQVLPRLTGETNEAWDVLITVGT